MFLLVEKSTSECVFLSKIQPTQTQNGIDCGEYIVGDMQLSELDVYEIDETLLPEKYCGRAFLYDGSSFTSLETADALEE